MLSLPDLPDQVGDHIRRKIKAKKQPARGGRPRGNPSADAEAFLNETLAIPPSVRMVVIGLLVGTIRRPRGRHRIDPADREFTRFAIQASLDFFVAGNSLPGRPPRSEFAGSDREWAIFETAHEHGRSEESVRDILGERKGWEDLRPEWSRKKG